MNKFFYLHSIWRQAVSHFELLAWLAALVLLFFMNMDADISSFCIFRFVGFESCPGCGIGHSIHYALHLDFARSFKEHPFGIVALLILLQRIKQLSFASNPKTCHDK